MSEAERLARLETLISVIQTRLEELENHLTDLRNDIVDLKLQIAKHQFFWKIFTPVSTALLTGLFLEGIRVLIAFM